MAHYLDTSALVKLVIAEDETPALEAWIAATDGALVACDLARTELLRAVRRVAEDRALRARTALASLTLTHVTSATFESAGRLEPSAVRSLDAIHLAATLELGDDLEGLVTYDDRMAEAAHSLGIAVHSPR